MKRDNAVLLEDNARLDGSGAPQPHQPGRAPPGQLGLEGRLARHLLGRLGDPPFRVTLWNGESIFTGGNDPVADIRIANRSTLLKLLVDPDVHFGEGYSDGSIEVEGDLVMLLEIVYSSTARASAGVGPRRLARWLDRPRLNTLSASRDNVKHHYDLGNDFYGLWLDQEMIYTCAYFPAPDVTLEQAQTAKMDLVCRKLRLRPEETVVEAGCGWGALALHMAAHYGVRVKAFNISREQIAYARSRARALGAEGRVEFIEDDYRNIIGRYDAFVSVGMPEHVGRDHYDEFGRVIDRCVDANGRGILHSIGRNRAEPLNAWIEKRIFPGAYPPSLREMLAILEPAGLTILDVENLRQHYALTLKHWMRRFEDARARVREMYGERFTRAWRLYLAGSRAAFNTGNLQLFQVLFARQTGNDQPWTRAHLYDR